MDEQLSAVISALSELVDTLRKTAHKFTLVSNYGMVNPYLNQQLKLTLCEPLLNENLEQILEP